MTALLDGVRPLHALYRSAAVGLTLQGRSLRVESLLGEAAPAETSPVDPAAFHGALDRAAKAHPDGLAVSVHPPEYYSKPGHQLYMDKAQTTGVGVDDQGYMFSAFAHPDANGMEIFSLFSKAALTGTALDCFDIGGKLPTMYGLFGFVPVARVPFNDEYAPPGWPYDRLGRPDVVLMVKKAGPRDPSVKAANADYNRLRDSVPSMDYDSALTVQREAVARLNPRS